MVDTGYRYLDRSMSCRPSARSRRMLTESGVGPGLSEQHDIQSLLFLHVKNVGDLVVSRLNI